MKAEDAGHSRPNAMTDGVDWFYPDSAEDARWFQHHHGAQPANPKDWPWPDWLQSVAPRPIRDRREPSAFAQAVVVLGIIALIAAFACACGGYVLVRIWGH
jgi:hypothetical protein